VRTNGRVRDEATGKRYTFVPVGLAEARERAMPVTALLNGVVQPRPRSLAARAVDEAGRNPYVADVLTDMATGLPDWTTVVRLLDHIDGSLGAERWSGLVKAGLLSRNEKSRIMATANNAVSTESARHGRRAKATPLRPDRAIALDEARAIVRRAARAWLESTCSP
jgi:hypothetical protein